MMIDVSVDGLLPRDDHGTIMVLSGTDRDAEGLADFCRRGKAWLRLPQKVSRNDRLQRCMIASGN